MLKIWEIFWLSTLQRLISYPCGSYPCGSYSLHPQIFYGIELLWIEFSQACQYAMMSLFKFDEFDKANIFSYALS